MYSYKGEKINSGILLCELKDGVIVMQDDLRT
jgi:hypothetical protein